MPKNPTHAYNPDCQSCARELESAKDWHGNTIRALGIVKGWVVVRRKGAAPFLLSWREWYRLQYVD